jgi:hypothetical protein
VRDDSSRHVSVHVWYVLSAHAAMLPLPFLTGKGVETLSISPHHAFHCTIHALTCSSRRYKHAGCDIPEIDSSTCQVSPGDDVALLHPRSRQRVRSVLAAAKENWLHARSGVFERPEATNAAAVHAFPSCVRAIRMFLVQARRQREDNYRLWKALRGHVECVVWTMIRQRVEAIPLSLTDRREHAIVAAFTNLTDGQLRRLAGE